MADCPEAECFRGSAYQPGFPLLFPACQETFEKESKILLVLA
jgi:hypothetical protein